MIDVNLCLKIFQLSAINRSIRLNADQIRLARPLVLSLYMVTLTCEIQDIFSIKFINYSFIERQTYRHAKNKP